MWFIQIYSLVHQSIMLCTDTGKEHEIKLGSSHDDDDNDDDVAAVTSRSIYI